MESEVKKPGNYLVFDGGLSGLPGLYTLEELLSRFQFDLKSDVELHPWRHFKVIIGSGPGGLIAIFIGRMKMTASEAIEAYTRLLPALSVPLAKEEEERSQNTEAFKAVFLDILKGAGYDTETPFMDENGPKTIVCTVNTANLSFVHLIRSYRSRSVQSPACTILEAACACIASPDIFLPVTIGSGHKQATLIDATTGFANPSQEILREAQRVFGGDEEVATLVSIGAGKGNVWSLSDGVSEKERLRALQQITMNCEPVHEELWGRLWETGIYYRLNVERGSGPQMQLSSNHILAYLQEGEISERLDNAIKSIQRRTNGVKLKDINSVAVVEVRLKPRPSLVPNFVGRNDILQAMHQTHVRDRSPGLHTPAITVLSGLGGSGKTQIALRFALDFEELYPEAPVYFLNAESEESLKREYEALIHSLGTEHRSKSHQDALIWLATKLKNWLLILDNADDPDLRLFAYIPKSKLGSVIITTRNANYFTGTRYSRHIIEGLSDSDSIALILESSGYEGTKENQDIVAEIVRELGNLPLALAQAAGYIFVNQCLSRYLDLYRKSTVKILSSSPLQPLNDYPLSVALTIQTSLDHLPQVVQDVMRLFAHLDCASITRSIIVKAAERRFEHVAQTEISECSPETLDHANALRKIFYKNGEWSEFEFNELVTQCLQYSLLQIRTLGEDNFYSMHVLVRAYLMAGSTSVQGHQPCRLAVRLLGSSITSSTHYEHLAFNRHLLLHIRLIQAEDVTEAGDHFGFGRVFYETGDFKLAIVHQQRCTEAWRASLGDEHVNTLRAIMDLANSYAAAGRNQVALELREQVVALRRRLSGSEHLETLKAMHNLALSYGAIGRNKEAMDIEEQVLEVRKRVLGPEDHLTLSTMGNLAASYSELGRDQDALRLNMQVLEIQGRVLGPEHPDTLMSMYNLTHSYREAGRETEAMELIERVVELRTRVMGQQHPQTAEAMWNLAWSLERLGLKERRLGLLQTAVPVYEKVWGVDHADTMKAKQWLKELEMEMEMEMEGTGAQ